ncbi:protein canopy homolog 2-like [Haliotis cracherodii]|uniref:protein canopy homolog 2-like n=1 Tax=Haliotis cracherodii TaxID=6455 RepID=UPI0039E8B142
MDVLGVALCLVVLFTVGETQRDKQLYCAVCRVVVDEMNWSISQVDPKKTLQAGSFRVDPKGNQAIKEIPYARSETHLTELVEEVCGRMNEYAQTTDDDGKKNIVRTNSRNGKPLSLKNIDINREIQKQLGFYCDSLIEEHEEDIIGLFKRKTLPNADRIICGDVSAACTEAELSQPLATLKAEEEAEEMEEDPEEDEQEDEQEPESIKEEL